jgi:signal recognition particle subunit SRP19
MSRRTAVVEEFEEEFDDDTDIPLPSRPLPNTGTRGAILEQIGLSDDEDEEDDDTPQLVQPSTSNPVSPAHPQFRGAQAPSRPENTVTDITPYKKYAILLPSLCL